MILRHSSLLKTALGNLTIKFAGAGLGLLNGICLARILGASDFGSYSLIIAAVNLLATLAAFGFPQLMARDIAAYRAHESWGLAKGLILVSHVWVLLASAIFMLTAYFLSSSIDYTAAISTNEKLIALLFIPCLSLSQLRAAAIRGMNNVLIADIPDLILRPAVILLSLLSWRYAGVDVDATYAVLLHLGAAILAALLGLKWLLTSLPDRLWQTPVQTDFPHWRRNAPTFLAIGLIGMLEAQAPIYLLGYLSTSENVGLYQAANQLVNAISMGLMAANLPLQPKLAAAWAKNDLPEFQRLTSEGARISAWGAILASAILVPFSGEALSLSGNHYEMAGFALRLLIAGQFFNAIMGPCGLVLSATRYQGVILSVRVLSLTVTCLMCYVLIPELPLEGAAIAVTCGLLSWNIALAWIAASKLDVFTPALGYAAFHKKPGW